MVVVECIVCGDALAGQRVHGCGTCGKLLCDECLQGIQNSGRSVKCPGCRADFKPPAPIEEVTFLRTAPAPARPPPPPQPSHAIAMPAHDAAFSGRSMMPAAASNTSTRFGWVRVAAPRLSAARKKTTWWRCKACGAVRTAETKRLDRHKQRGHHTGDCPLPTGGHGGGADPFRFIYEDDESTDEDTPLRGNLL